MNKVVLLTGGAGYIGSHTYSQLIEAGFKPIILDNFTYSKPQIIARLESISAAPVFYITADMRDRQKLEAIFLQYPIEAVIHFAGLKAVGESVARPLTYYDNNVNGTLALLSVMKQHHVKTLVFSSSATVYGDPKIVPIQENAPLSATNPYGRSKLIIEEILRDLHQSDASWRIGILRYFNPIGAHQSGLIGEDPQGTPTNLMPYITQVAVNKLAQLMVFGGDYPTIDGTGVRDYIHVMDLAQGHVNALQILLNQAGLITVNLGTGQGYSVLQIIAAFNRASGKKIAYQIGERRAGDIAICYADPGLAKRKLNWQAKYDLDTMCVDSWRWQQQNPDGLI